MAVAKFLDCSVWSFGLEGIWLRYATLQNLIPSFPWIAPGRRKERKESNFAIWQPCSQAPNKKESNSPQTADTTSSSNTHKSKGAQQKKASKKAKKASNSNTSCSSLSLSAEDKAAEDSAAEKLL